MKTDPEYDNLFDVLLNLNIEVKDYLSAYDDNHRALVTYSSEILDRSRAKNPTIQKWGICQHLKPQEVYHRRSRKV